LSNTLYLAALLTFHSHRMHFVTLSIPTPFCNPCFNILPVPFSIPSTFKWISFSVRVCASPPPLYPMSFLPSHNHVLAVDLWPSPYNSLIEQRAIVSKLQQWQCFPRMLNQLAEWATVARLPSSLGNARDRLLVYKTLPASDTNAVLYPISVWVFGFLENFSLGDYGDWKGYVSVLFSLTSSLLSCA